MLVTHTFHDGVRNEKSNILCRQDSIWWNLKARDKPLGLVQGCSTKKQNEVGSSQFHDILTDGVVISCVDIANKFYMPPSH